jgi:erythromycin esterase
MKLFSKKQCSFKKQMNSNALKASILWLLLIFMLISCKSLQDDTTPQEPISPDHLYTDEELYTEEDPNAPDVKEEWAAWIKENYIPIRSLTSKYFSDLQFLKPLLDGRRIVQLGESGHGVAEFNKVKVRLIKFLHQEMGFQVMAFESSIFDCFYSNDHEDEFSAITLMRQSIFGVWHTEEVLELFEYIKETQETENPLILAGFDTQFSGQASANRPEFFQDIINVIDSNYAQTVYELGAEFRAKRSEMDRDSFKEYLRSDADQWIEAYEALVTFFDNNMDALNDAFSDKPLYPLIARQSAWSMIQYISQIVETDSLQASYIRDRGMGTNLITLANTIYPGKKIIVWAHNFHIRHNQEAVSASPVKTMGAWVAEEFRPELYTIGLYMYRGSAAYNNRDIYTIPTPYFNSLEAICYRARCKFLFVDMLNEQLNTGNAWMFERIYVRSWGKYNYTMILRDQYDGILFIDTVNPPSYM